MKHHTPFHYLAFTAIFCVCAILLASCSHNGNLVGVGKVLRIGNDTCGITYVNGLFSVNSSRENSESVIETNDGDSFNATPGAAVSGVRSIRWRTSPQITGYLVDLAKIAPDAAAAYVAVMPSLHHAQWDAKQQTPLDAPKLPNATSCTAISKADMFLCNGNCDYNDLTSHDSISYQSSIVVALSGYDCSAVHPDSGETYAQSLADFARILETYAAHGLATTRVRIKSVTVADRKVTNLLYAYVGDDGTITETQCPNCTPWELPDMLETPADE